MGWGVMVQGKGVERDLGIMTTSITNLLALLQKNSYGQYGSNWVLAKVTGDLYHSLGSSTIIDDEKVV